VTDLTEALQAALQPACAHGGPLGQGVIRQQPEDFIVDEISSVELTGEGEHVCLHIRKRGLNTEDVARQLAKLADVKRRDVSFAGLKDRHAVTSQWFSVYLPGVAELDWQSLGSDDVQVLEVCRNARKLRRGTLAGNLFQITVREFDVDAEMLDARLQDIAQQGVPNYFGSQRFGRGGSNLEQALEMFAGRRVKREQRSHYLSAVRSMLFNRVLSQRVSAGTWNQLLDGEVCMLAGSRGFFVIDTVDETLQQRLLAQDIHPSGPLWGKGELPSQYRAHDLETAVLAGFADWCKGLEKAGLKMERRSLRLIAEDLQWTYADKKLVLTFSLPAGCFATAVLREIVET
jgi:tRNA pseudouridine13 synthase